MRSCIGSNQKRRAHRKQREEKVSVRRRWSRASPAARTEIWLSLAMEGSLGILPRVILVMSNNLGVWMEVKKWRR